MSEQQWTRRTAFKHRGPRSDRVDVRGGPDGRKFERDTASITGKIKELENKLKPVASNATQLIVAEIAKESAELADIEKAKEANAVEMKAIDTKIKEIGVEYKEKKMVSNDLLAGVRHKTESRHDDAVERLEQQILIRRCSTSEERKFKQEIDALKKSRERLIEYNAAKSVVDTLKLEQEDHRARRDSLHRQHKELRMKDLSQKDRITHLKQELEEAKERKKVGVTEREGLKKEIDALNKERKELFNRFRSEQLAFNEQLHQQSEEERMRRDENRAIREERRRYRAIEQTFEQEQQYRERLATCNALISHLQRLSLTSHTGVTTPPDPDNLDPSPPTSATNLDPTPRRSESDPTTSKEAGFILRRGRDEVLVPTTVTLTRKKSKKEKKRNVPIFSKRFHLNPTIFRQFGSLDLAPPSTLSDIPHILSQLQDKMIYFEGMTKAHMFLPPDLMDSGLGSTAPSEMLDLVDRDTDFSNSQEEPNLDPGLGSAISPKRSLSEDANGGPIPLPSTAALPQRSATDHMTPRPTNGSTSADVPSSDKTLVQLYDNVLPHNLVSMASSSTNASGSGTSIAVGGGDE